MLSVVTRRNETPSDLLREYWDGSLPVRLTEMSTAMGAEKYEADLGNEVLGLVTREADGKPQAILNGRLSAARRRFMWAHLLGRIASERSKGTLTYSFISTHHAPADERQAEADEFARALLLPSEELQRLRAEGLTPGELARSFGVTVGTVISALESLGGSTR